MKAGWQARRLGDLCQLVGGGTPSKRRKEFYGGDIPWATVRDMRSDVITETEHKITKAAVGASATNVIPGGNVVIATRVGLGKVSRIGQDTAINQDLRGVVPINPAVLSVPYLFWWLKSIAGQIVAAGTGATVQGVRLPFVKGLQVPLPPLLEQQRIVGVLDEAFAAIATARAKTQQSLAAARELFGSVLNAVFADQGAGWVERQFGAICGFVRGPFGASLTKAMFVENGYAVYEQSHAISNQFADVRYFIDEARFMEMRRYEVHPGDMIMSCSGTIGRIAIAPDGVMRGIINQALLKLSPRSDVAAAFLRYWMQSEDFLDRLAEYSGGAAIQNVASVRILKEIPVPVPPPVEQRRLIALLDEVDLETRRLGAVSAKKLEALDALKQSVLYQAFSGAL